MAVIMQSALPKEMAGASGLPGIAPCAQQDWLRIDDAYAAQMAHREMLLRTRRNDVLWAEEEADAPCLELLDEVLGLLPDMGFEVSEASVLRPDGRQIDIDRRDPMGTLGLLVQEDLCVLEKRGDEHVLIAAVLCFPASWRLAEKVGRPLIGIHHGVTEYNETLARRVQRLFDGVKPGRPMWRFNKLWYDDPELFQPRSAAMPRRISPGEAAAPYIRSERQCIVRLPQTGAAVFTIHTYVVAQ